MKTSAKSKRGSALKRLIILDEETTFLAGGLNDKMKAIYKEEELRSHIDEVVQAKEVIILVELDWGTPVSKFYGYEVAKRLMMATSHGTKFNVLFISTLDREILYRLHTTKNRIFIQKFPHFQITSDFTFEKVSVPKLSERKFDYLANYCLLEAGVVDLLEHAVKRFRDNPEPEKLQRIIDDLNANREILGDEISAKVETLLTNTDPENQKNLLSEIHRLLQDLSRQLNNPEEAGWKKSHSTVLLIEDDSPTLQMLKTQLGHFFNNIISFSTGTHAAAELRKNAHKYDVVITDMELLVGNFDDDIQGIDILELCEKDYPFLVTRVISGLPKNALKHLTGKRLDEIIFKGSGNTVIPPTENLVEFVDKIDNEVRRRKVLRAMPGPKISWWGKYLTRKMYLTQINDSESYSAIWGNAISTANAFVEGDLDYVPNEEKLSTEFKAIRDTVDNPESGWEIIELLLTHRLIVIWYVARNKGKYFYWTGESGEVYVKQKGFRQGLESKSSKAYFNTLIGFSGSGLSMRREATQKCTILLKDLFPKEIEWLNQWQHDLVDEMTLGNINFDFLDFIQDFARLFEDKEITEEITFGEALEYLNNFVHCYPEERYDKKKHKELKEYVEEEYDLIYESIPEMAKNVIDQIKQIFSPQI